MRLGIFAKTFPGSDPASVMQAAARSGYSCVQYNMACSGLPSMPQAIDPDYIAAIEAARRISFVESVALSGTYNMIHPDVRVRERGHTSLAVLAAAASQLSIPLVTLCTGTRDTEDQWREHPDNDSPEAWRDLCASMETAIEIADRFAIDLGIEPEMANVVNSAQKARQLIDELGSSRLKIVLDPANLFEVETPDSQRRIVSAAIDLLADRIVMGHAKDRAADGTFATAGTGVLDYRHYFLCLKRAGFDGPMITHGLAAGEAPGVADFLRQSMAEAGIENTP